MRRIWRRGSWVLLLLSVAMLGTGCFLPLGWGATGGDSEESTGTITVHLGGIGASTLVPHFGAIVDSYRVTASRPGYDDLVVSDTASPIPLLSLAIGTWTVTVEAIDADNGDAVVGTSEPESVSVDSGAATSVTITVEPTTAGNGDLDLTVTWPSGESLTVGAFTLTPDGGSDVSGSVTQTAVSDGVHLSTSGDTLSAGSYTLLLQLQRSGADVATVIEAVRIYDNVTTTATMELAAGEIGDAPVAPNGLSATESANANVDLTWSDASNTELSYKVERSENGGSSYTVLDEALPAGTESYTDTTVGTNTEYHYRVSALNDFGSSPAITSITTFGRGDLTVTLDVSQPSQPTINFGGAGGSELDSASGQMLVVTATGDDIASVQWYLNGSTSYPVGGAIDADSTDATTTIDSANLERLGTYTVAAIVTDSEGDNYSASFSFELIANYEDLAIAIEISQPQETVVGFDFGGSSSEELDQAAGDTLSVDATGGSFDGVDWYLNGQTTYPDGSTLDADSGDTSLLIDSSTIDTLGSYIVTAVATDTTGSYSASFSFNLVAYYEELAIVIEVAQPEDTTVEIGGLESAVSLGSSREISATAGFSGYTWYLNGLSTYEDGSPFSTTGNTFSMDSSELYAGTHIVTVGVENVVGEIYSTQETFTVEN